MMKRALISVSDKAGVVEFARNLISAGFEIISTGGTLKALADEGISAMAVDSVTGFAECLDGRVKTLHPGVHGGILAVRDNENHMKHIRDLGIPPIDIVVVNLYPFKKTILKENTTLDEAIENIDIGGPAMVRSAAKNYKSVAIVTDSADYNKISEEIKVSGAVSAETKMYLSAKAFAHTGAYDALIADYLREAANMDILEGNTLTLTYERDLDLRYGENPHQNAAFYREVKPPKGSLIPFEQLHGKQVSFNNINDLTGAVALLKELDNPACVCVKHSVPCGVAEAGNLHEAFIKACESDPVSIFGGIAALNGIVDLKCAEEMNKVFLEIVIAPDYTAEGLEELKKKKNLRIIKNPDAAKKLDEKYFDLKKVLGGVLIQEIDDTLINPDELKCVTLKQPAKEEMEDLIFAFKVVKHTKSNGITVCKNKQTIGIGGGQVRRSWALEQAIDHGNEIFGEGICKGAVMASDAFFPYSDSVELAHKAGITAIIQPGGSVKDEDSIELCNKYGISMLFTGIRHFRH
ncbi:MAG: bifunctional phosphoribosylaminoimidazolecarboxamide formyltransferase/IMP cyclohydrolase [Defluviitaleaceae bacterium]|nr:bifunctional phosphoribosylaminoimidazolecarboxamide formyltransferase/IMP cyclohydrolase [Defluviitaleaceae bacterium]